MNASKVPERLWPTHCPLHLEVALHEEPGIARGLRRRRCPLGDCDYVTPSFRPERRRSRRAPAPAARRSQAARGSSWHRNDYWRDQDERNG